MGPQVIMFKECCVTLPESGSSSYNVERVTINKVKLKLGSHSIFAEDCNLCSPDDYKQLVSLTL